MDREESYGFPDWPYSNNFFLTGCFYDRLSEGEDYHEPCYEYKPIPNGPNLRLHGYFQSWRYFLSHENFVRSVLTPRAYKKETLVGTSSLHVRRGDYIGNPYHPVLSMDYYLNATDILKDKGVEKFIVFSDDPEWCKSAFSAPHFEVASPGNEVHHLSTMISCEHHIIANSSFSWWGAWLNPSNEKKVIAPAQWFGEERQQWSLDDLIPPDWIRI